MKRNLIYVALGLILAWWLSFAYTEGVEYTINWWYTQVSIPETDIEWVTVNRWDESEDFNVSLDSEYCSERNINRIKYVRCEKVYNESGEYTVTLDWVENIFTIYLDDANIKTLTDFSWFSKLKNLYLDYNTGLELGQFTFSAWKLPKLTYLSLMHNELNDFPSTLRFLDIRVDLQYNNLTTIPESLLDWYISDITLQNWINYMHSGWSSAYKRDVDLRNNPINFIKISNSPDEEDTSHTFERFAYSNPNDGYTEFQYWTDFTSTWTTTEKQVTINNLHNWSHHFTVCYSNNESVCSTVEFTTDLPNSLTITSPNDTNLISAHQTFSREWQHPYKEWYCYEFTKDEWEYTPIQACPTDDTSFTVDNLSDWDYTLKISMRDNENNMVGDELEEHYNVSLRRIVTITRVPNITTKNYRFSRYWSADDFVKYTYLLTGDSYPTTQWDTTDTYFNASNLKDGHYRLTVTIQWEWWSNMDIREFDVSINRDLELETSLLWNTITLDNITWTDVNIYRTWSSERFNHYTYELKRNNEHYSWWTSNQPIDSVLYTRLPSGTYDFYIEMYDEDEEPITSNSTTFTINIPSNLTINSPAPWTQSNNITFDREGFAENFDHYEYILERTDWWTYRKTWTWNQNFTQFSLTWLHHWNYTFTVNINDASSNIITGKNVSFSISDDVALTSKITSNNSVIPAWGTGNSKTVTFSREWRSEDFAWYYYSIVGVSNSYNYTWKIVWQKEWSITLNDLSTGKYRFTINMLDSENNEITSNTTDFNIVIPASIKITSPNSGTTITSSSAVFTRTWFSDTITKYEY